MASIKYGLSGTEIGKRETGMASEVKAGLSTASQLLSALGINPSSFHRFVNWALCEHLATSLAHDPRVLDSWFTIHICMIAHHRVADVFSHHTVCWLLKHWKSGLGVL